jgi:hypothetical protein
MGLLVVPEPPLPSPHFGQVIGPGKVFKLCRLRVKAKLYRSDGAMPLLRHNDLAYTVNFSELLLPVLIAFVEFLIGFIGAADRLTRLIVFLAGSRR